jgi:hypothetical protein
VTPAARRFGPALVAIALAGFGLRVLYSHLVPYSGGGADDLWYHAMANAIANGHGLTVPRNLINGSGSLFDYSGPTVPTAFHPPLFPALLAIGSKLGLTSYEAHRVIGCALGGATVGVVGLIGRRIGGAGLGLLAAGIAAIYLPLMANESVLMSESLYGLTIAATILTALRFGDAPSWRRAAALGAAIGLAALTRAEALLLLVVLVPFAVRQAPSMRLRHLAVVVGVTALVIAPWCIRNTTTFDRPVGITTGDGAVLAGANNQPTYHGFQIGAWNLGGLVLPPAPGPDRYNEAAGAIRLRRKGLDYARDHAGRAAIVAGVRVLRTWSIYPFDPVDKVRYTAFVSARRRGYEWAGLISAWAAMALAIAGAVGLRRRGVPLAPLVAPLALVTIVSALCFGDLRFREAADVSVVVLAAAGLRGLRR